MTNRLLHRTIYLTVGALLVLLTACSTQKNTWATRSYHQTKVKYNILYNGNTAYEEGLKAIQNANEDNYSAILSLYPVSNHTAAAASASQMDRTIEKCRKCIKLHSIKSRPKPDPKKRNDPKYKLWLQQEEFNNQMGKAWLRLGEAEFHKGDFLGSVGTFSYISKHYSTDPDMVACCQLWTARAYAEMGWLYEAEDMLQKVQIDALSKKHARLYSSVSADILIKTGQYHAAIPFVKSALPDEKRTVYRPRFAYVLGQLYERERNRQEAVNAYRQVLRMSPKPEMEFNARIRIAQLSGKSALKSLRQMTKQSKYKDRLDLIYGAIGNIYLASGDTVQALRHYHKAIDEATQASMDKAAVLVRAGDIYFDRQDYAAAQPCYREAVTILPATDADYARLQQRSEVLDELIQEHATVVLQDSLQRLSRMSEAEQRAVVEKLIADLLLQEQQAAEEEAQAARQAADGGLQSVNTSNMLGGSGAAGDWYFYNPQLMRSGKQEFTKRWGQRTLEDNWRRRSKTVVSSFADEPQDEDLEPTDSLQTLSPDSTTAKPARVETDNHKPEYYLQQIPRGEGALALSDSLIRHALINMVYIYQDKLSDRPLADRTFEELQERFPAHADLLDLYYMYYLHALRDSDAIGQASYRQAITTLYPTSQQAYIVSQPDYFDRLRRMAVEQDSLYEDTYNAYTQGAFAQVKTNKAYAEQQYPLSPLMPRFLFLNAIAVARTDGQTAFVSELQDMVRRYPESELGAMAKDMLAMMGQGMESQQGTTQASSLGDLRAETTQQEDEEPQEELTDERNVASVVLFYLPKQDEALLNRLQYETALFNFSQFLIRDFDLQKMPVVGDGCALRIIGFESMDEAEWWIGLVRANTELTATLAELQVEITPLPEQNVSRFRPAHE